MSGQIESLNVSKEQVLKAIDTERAYQDGKFPEVLSVGGELKLLLHYLKKADECHRRSKGDLQGTVEVIRELAGICIRCMEHHGAIPREIREQKIPEWHKDVIDQIGTQDGQYPLYEKEKKEMDIRAEEGTKIVFSNPDAGYPDQIKLAASHLTVGATYTVEETEVHSWHTDVYIKEVPSIAFNSCLFSEV